MKAKTKYLYKFGIRGDSLAQARRRLAVAGADAFATPFK